MGVTAFTSAVAAPGTPQRLVSGASPALPQLSGVLSGTITPRGGQIKLTADPGNTAGKYLWVGGPSLNVAGNNGWFAKVSPGQTVDLVELGGGSVDVGDYFIDTDGVAGAAKYGVEVVG